MADIKSHVMDKMQSFFKKTKIDRNRKFIKGKWKY